MSGASEEQLAARILVVDDDLHTRSLLKELCESQGHLVDQAADGLVALERIGVFKPDLVLLDVMMPGLDGFGVLGKVRSSPELAKLPVIILTAAGDIDGKIRGIELGADDYITKPFRLFELTTRVRSALAVKRYQERLQAAEQELEGLRSGDLLTGTGSYPQLRAALDYEVARARRYSRPLSALLMCVENLDVLRAQLGRAQMDKVAKELVERLREGLRETDRLFRIDRDEFVALLPETDRPGAQSAAERVLKQVASHPSQLQLLVGLADFPAEAVQTPEDVMRAAQRDLEAQRAKLGK